MQQSNIETFGGNRDVPTLSDLLRRDIDEFVIEFRRTNRLLRSANEGVVSPETLGRYLRSLHFLIQATLRHLALAEESAQARGYDLLAAHFAEKRAEETGHDRWAETDMTRLAQKFRVAIPDEPTSGMRAIVDANTEMVRADPHLYLAYMLFAEYVTVVLGPEWLAALSDKCGIPGSYLSVIEKHVELDEHHATEGCEAIDLFFDGRPASQVREALQGMMRRFAEYCDELSGAAA